MADVELKPVYLITGSDRPKVELALQRLRRHFDDQAIDRYHASACDGETAIQACNAGTLFGGARLVIVEEVDGRPDDEGRLKTTWKAPDLEAVIAYIAAPAPGTVLCLVGTAIKKDSPLTKACTKAGAVLAYDVAKGKATVWAAERFKAKGVRAEPEACALLAQLVGDRNLHALAEEVDKLIAWAGVDGVVDEAVVAELVAPMAETPVFAITDAWGARNRAAALTALEATLDRAGRPRRDETARVAGALGSHLGKLKEIKRAAAAGERPKDAAARLKQHPFYVEKLFRQADAFSERELEEATMTLAALDHALKGGSRLAPELEAQRALSALAREPGK
ncbi:MAG: DNA polymerase III subunit delta [Gaiellales bacterium]